MCGACRAQGFRRITGGRRGPRGGGRDRLAAPGPVGPERPTSHLRAAATGVLVLAVVTGTVTGMAACGRATESPGSLAPGTASSSVSPSESAAPTVSTPASASGTHTASAADQLAPFFAAATRADQQLRRAAGLVNAGIGSREIVLDATMVRAVKAIDTDAVVRAVPGGLPPTLLRSVLEVYADLSSRQAAFNRILEYAPGSPLPRAGDDARDLIRCLGNGASPTASFGADLAASRSVAAATAPVKVAPVQSRQAAEVAIRAGGIRLPNNGCGECGGYVPRPIVLPPIVWKHTELAGIAWDGTIGSTQFSARYVVGKGWDVAFNAC